MKSNFVIDESQDGNADFVKRRLEFLKGIPALDYDVETVCGMSYLLSWNCKHICVSQGVLN